MVDVLCGEDETIIGAPALGMDEDEVEEVVCRLVDGRRAGGGMGGCLEKTADFGRGEEVGGEIWASNGVLVTPARRVAELVLGRRAAFGGDEEYNWV